MPVDLTQLNATIATLTTEVARTEGTEDSAGALILGFSAAVTTAVTAAVAQALQADATASAAAVAAANDAIAAVTARFVAADDKLGAAIAANPGPGVPPTT